MKNTLAILLKERGISAKKVSESTHIDVSTLSKIKNFERSISQENAIILSDFFKISIDELFNREFNIDFDKKKKLSYDEVLFKLNELSDDQLLSIAGAIDYLLISRRPLIKYNGEEEHLKTK
ncbi:helix-turn-helix transcriptional regulator [Candidatus Izemoplasma sp. B36]|uniref:helix-turn-helix transcriptional regulator n=1 Tax=Candidatus Izemoplasma sp. B36 TaxID=3242468 RepID=UPI003559185A